MLETSISVDLNIHDVAVARIDNKLDRATMVNDDACGKLWQEVDNGMSKHCVVNISDNIKWYYLPFAGFFLSANSSSSTLSSWGVNDSA